MSDTIGRITVPDLPASGTFPITPEWGYSYAEQAAIAQHQFGSGNAKIFQAYQLGPPLKRFTVRCEMTETQRASLRDFFDARKGIYEPFTLNWPTDDGSSTTAYTVRFADQALTFQYLTDALSSTGLTLVEVNSAPPTYAVSATQDRFPSGSLPAALLSQTQQLIPLLKIRVKEAAVDDIFLSDRRCTVGGQLYQARLLRFEGISQRLGGPDATQDVATFVFGNADRVMRDLAGDTNLQYATISFSLYHVGTGIKIDLWRGDVVDWAGETAPEFSVQAADGCYELTLQYPLRPCSRTCDKPFDHASLGCPYTAQGALNANFPSASALTCDHGYDTANGCLAHTMKRYFHGLYAKPQGCYIKFTGSSGGVRLNATSQVSESLYSPQSVLPEIYVNGVSMPVNGIVAAGREENTFYDALVVIGEGPLGHIDSTFSKHTLDGQPAHGPAPLGLRYSLGNDPALQAAGVQPSTSDHFFALGRVGDSHDNTEGEGHPKQVYWDGGTYEDIFAAGTAFAEIRRSDASGMQVSKLAEHSAQIWVDGGFGGWYWTTPGTRLWAASSTNPIWIAVNIWLRAKGLWFASAATQETAFDAQAACDAAANCNSSVTKMIGAGTETQWVFHGVIGEQKPLRDWLSSVLATALGYWTFRNGKLRVGLRMDSSTVEAFTAGNILFNSLELSPLRPQFNRLVGQFGNEETDWQADALTVADQDHAQEIAGAGAGPQWLQAEMPLVGASTRSRVARIITTRLREEIGGVTAAQRKAARNVAFRTTVLALNVEPGQVDSLTHADMPGGAGEFRVTGWRLNPDYSIDITGRTTTDSMYDYVGDGPKPADVAPDPVPGEVITDLVPGDVQAWGGNPFGLTVTEDGTTATIEVEYDPPAEVGILDGVQTGAFAGVVIDIQDVASGDSTLSQSFDFNGDASAAPGDAARHGTATVKYPQPSGADQNVVVRCGSWSRAFRKPIDASTPQIAATIHQATTGAIVPGDVTSLTAVSRGYHFMPGQKVDQIIGLHYTPPFPLGTFLGVHVYAEIPDASGADGGKLGAFTLDSDALGEEFAPQDLGRFPYRTSDSYHAIVELPAVTRDTPAPECEARFYLVSYGADVENSLVPANEASPSPNLTFTMSPRPATIIGEEWAPLIVGPSVVKAVRTNDAGTSTTYLYPSFATPDDPRYNGVYIEVWNSDHTQLINAGVFGSQMPADGSVPSNYFPTPNVVQDVWVIFRSYSDPNQTATTSDDAINTYVPGVTPEVSISIGVSTGVLDPTALVQAALDSTDFQIAAGKLALKNLDFAKVLGTSIESTEFLLSGGKFTVNGIDLTKAISAKFSSEFQVAGGKFEIKELAATKITAGTMVAGVIYAGDIAATQILAGALGVGVVYAGTINVSQINAGTLGVGVLYAGSIAASQIAAGTMSVSSDTGLTIDNGAGRKTAHLDGYSNFWSSSVIRVRVLGTTGNVDVFGSGGYPNTPWARYSYDGVSFDSVRVIKAQQAAVTDPSGGSVIDVECRAQLSALLARLRAATGHGLIA